MEASAIAVELDEDQARTIEGGWLRHYTESSTTPISRWTAYVLFQISHWFGRRALNRVHNWHPWRVFHEGQLALRLEAVGDLPMKGILQAGPPEPRLMTTVKIIAIFCAIWIILSFLTSLGPVDLFNFDLIRVHLTTGI